MIRLLCATLMGLVLSAPAASANAPDAWQKQALTVAQRVWHPACGQLKIEWGDPAGVLGDAEWGGWTYLGECTIYEPIARRWLGYPDFCSAVLHEAGHAAGFEHSKRGIMAADRTVVRNEALIDGRLSVLWSGADSRCLRKSDRAAKF